jgi:hypothetical protein
MRFKLKNIFSKPNLPLTHEPRIIINTIYDNDEEQRARLKLALYKKLPIYIISIIFFVVFAFIDMYIANYIEDCNNQKIPMIINLKNWFVIGSIFQVVTFLAFIFNLAFSNNCGKNITIIIYHFVNLFLLSWNIMGCIIFYKYLINVCAQDVGLYLWFRMIIGLVCNIANLFYRNKN